MTMYLASQVFPLKLDKTTAFILMALCDSAEDDGSRCFPSPPYVAWKTGCGKSTVYRVIETLVDMGVLEEVGLYGTTMEYFIHLEKAPMKTPWERRRIGRPRQSPATKKVVPARESRPTVGNISHSEKSRPTARKVVPQREKSSQGGKAALAANVPPSQEKSDAKSASGVSYPNLITHSYIPKLIDPPRVSTKKDEKAEGASPLHHPLVEPITEIRRKMEDVAPHPHSAAPLAPARDLWRRIKEEVGPRFNPVQRQQYLDRLDFGHIEAEDWAILAPTPFSAEYVQKQWGQHFEAALHRAAGPDAQLHIVSFPKGSTA